MENRNEKIRKEIQSILERHVRGLTTLQKAETRLNEEKDKVNQTVASKNPEMLNKKGA